MFHWVVCPETFINLTIILWRLTDGSEEKGPGKEKSAGEKAGCTEEKEVVYSFKKWKKRRVFIYLFAFFNVLTVC
jgi:hypothetical protein